MSQVLPVALAPSALIAIARAGAGSLPVIELLEQVQEMGAAVLIAAGAVAEAAVAVRGDDEAVLRLMSFIADKFYTSVPMDAQLAVQGGTLLTQHDSLTIGEAHALVVAKHTAAEYVTYEPGLAALVLPLDQVTDLGDAGLRRYGRGAAG